MQAYIGIHLAMGCGDSVIPQPGLTDEGVDIPIRLQPFATGLNQTELLIDVNKPPD